MGYNYSKDDPKITPDQQAQIDRNNRLGRTVGTITSVDTPAGENLVKKDPLTGIYQARNGNQGEDPLLLAGAQLARDNRGPQTVGSLAYPAGELPTNENSTLVAPRPFSTAPGAVNDTPYGQIKISSEPRKPGTVASDPFDLPGVTPKGPMAGRPDETPQVGPAADAPFTVQDYFRQNRAPGLTTTTVPGGKFNPYAEVRKSIPVTPTPAQDEKTDFTQQEWLDDLAKKGVIPPTKATPAPTPLQPTQAVSQATPAQPSVAGAATGAAQPATPATTQGQATPQPTPAQIATLTGAQATPPTATPTNLNDPAGNKRFSDFVAHRKNDADVASTTEGIMRTLRDFSKASRREPGFRGRNPRVGTIASFGPEMTEGAKRLAVKLAAGADPNSEEITSAFRELKNRAVTGSSLPSPELQKQYDDEDYRKAGIGSQAASTQNAVAKANLENQNLQQRSEEQVVSDTLGQELAASIGDPIRQQAAIAKAYKATRTPEGKRLVEETSKEIAKEDQMVMEYGKKLLAENPQADMPEFYSKQRQASKDIESLKEAQKDPYLKRIPGSTKEIVEQNEQSKDALELIRDQIESLEKTRFDHKNYPNGPDMWAKSKSKLQEARDNLQKSQAILDDPNSGSGTFGIGKSKKYSDAEAVRDRALWDISNLEGVIPGTAAVAIPTQVAQPPAAPPTPIPAPATLQPPPPATPPQQNAGPPDGTVSNYGKYKLVNGKWVPNVP